MNTPMLTSVTLAYICAACVLLLVLFKQALFFIIALIALALLTRRLLKLERSRSIEDDVKNEHKINLGRRL